MRKLTLLIFPLFIYSFVSAQREKKPALDSSVIKRDSTDIRSFKDAELDDIPTLTLDDNSLNSSSSENVPLPLAAGRDPFYSASYYNFSPLRFKSRGYDADFSSTYINGVPMNNLDNGYSTYNQWGGLTDILHDRQISIGLADNNYGFGSIGNSLNIDMRASYQRAGTSIGYSNSDRTYTDRWTFTHSTGVSKKGWAFSFSGSRRWSNQGYVPGTYINAWSYFVAVDKRFGKKNLLSFVAFGAPKEEGLAAAATQEMFTLAGTHYYNPDWGYQDGKVRDANVSKINQPVGILTWEWRIKSRASLKTGVSYTFGTKSTSGIDYYNAPDPYPDYYGYLPSNFLTDPVQYAELEKLYSTDESVRQINWQQLYNINRNSIETINDVNGIAGNSVTGARSLYILSDRVTNTKKLTANTTFNTVVGHMRFTAGVSFEAQKDNQYEQVADLLGGQFYVNLNEYAEEDNPTNPNDYQNNVNDPNQILHVGDKYGYNYDINLDKGQAFAQSVFNFNKFQFFVAGQVSEDQFWRVGNYENGLFPDSSYGKSAVNSFTNYGAKGGVTYKIDGRNYLYVNGAYLTRPPTFQNVYESPTENDVEQSGLTNQTVQSAEGGYVMNSPKLRIRLSGYYTVFKNGFQVESFYDEQYDNYVNYALSNIDKLHFGGEFGFETNLTPTLSLQGAASAGRYYYTSRQNAVVTLDNSAAVLEKDVIYSINYRVPSTPQEAYSLGVTYRSRKYWFLSLTGNYFDQLWLEKNPIRLTTAAVVGLDPTSAQYQEIINQTEVPAEFTVDFYGGYSWKLPKKLGMRKRTFLVINAGIQNLLNNQNIINGGYEQLRYDFETQNPSTFPDKYYYAYGITYYISAILRFN